MPKLKDTDFLYLSALVHQKENKLIPAAALDRMIKAETPRDAIKIPEEYGYGPVDPPEDPVALHGVLSQKTAAVLHELANQSPDPRVADIFRIKYDYHNAKAWIKTGDVPRRVMSEGGRISPQRLIEGNGVPEALGTALREAKAVLSETRDAQRADIILDRSMYGEYTAIAEGLGDGFLRGYVRLLIDTANLRTAVRAARMGMRTETLKKMDALVPGGDVPPYRLTEGTPLETLYNGTALGPAAAAAKDMAVGGDLTEFENLAGNALSAYLKKARLIPFGIAPVLAYMAALEAETVAIRIIMAGRAAGMDPDAIRERLRD